MPEYEFSGLVPSDMIPFDVVSIDQASLTGQSLPCPSGRLTGLARTSMPHQPPRIVRQPIPFSVSTSKQGESESIVISINPHTFFG